MMKSMIELLMLAILIVIPALVVMAFIKHWLSVEQARHDEIRRRERLRIFLATLEDRDDKGKR